MIAGTLFAVAVICLITALLDMMMNGARYSEWAPWGLGIALAFILVASALGAELPDPRKTPGDIDETLTADVICAKEFRTGPYRNVSAKLKRKVYASYRKKPSPGKCCEVDHLISIEIGGSNSQKNLWPQGWKEAKIKDQLENRLHRLVCNGDISLEEAQTEIRTDWWKAYQKYVH